MRECGACQLCCKLLPISEIGKKANARCGNQKFGVGCKVHGTVAQPMSCKAWSCMWLRDPTMDFGRPDQVGYVVDPTPDFIVVGDDAFKGERIPAIQVWCDPKRPDAWRDDRLQRWLAAMIDGRKMVIVVRFSDVQAVTVVPPHLSETGGWMEMESMTMLNVTAAHLRSDHFRKMFERQTKSEEA